METGLTKNQIISELSRSPHGKLQEYIDVGQKATKQEPEFMAHLIAWDRHKGQVRDSKVALPIVSLSMPGFPEELVENSFAHFALLGPRELLRAYRFALQVKLPGRMNRLTRVVRAYLRDSELDRGWNRLAVQHRHTLKELYAITHTKPSKRADDILFKGEKPQGSVFADVAQLKDMAATEAAGVIMERNIPFLIAMGALGAKAKDPDVVLALINRMSATELVTNTKMLERLGVKTNPALKGAFDAALQKAAKSTENVLKTTKAIESVQDEGMRDKLRGLQEKQIQSKSVEGNWLVLADKSGSMHQSIEVAKHVAAILAKMVKGKVWLVFFDTTPQTIDVTGAALDVIQKATQYIGSGGGTSIGCGLNRMLESKTEVDGIAIISDGGENTAPLFCEVYKRYSAHFGKEVPVYMYQCKGDHPHLLMTARSAGVDIQVFELGASIDYYSLPNLVATMRTNRYSLVDEIMAVPLLTLDKVFKKTGKEELTYA